MREGDWNRGPEGDPLWYQDAILYEVHVRAFFDSDGDGMGDFPGLTQKLDYLHDLGVNTIWLLPFCASPWRDDGYDISDYNGVHPAYGTLRDFQTFLREAHRRGVRVVTELVLNHTSDQHAWFQRSRRAEPGSRWRNFYVWSDTPEKYREARIIFKDFEASNWTWDPVAKAYYWHRFYSHQPDLNYENPEVRAVMLQAVDFWLDMGVDGLRLDAVPYLYEREGTTCENLPETHAFLRELRRHVEARYRDRMLLAEANQWPEDAIAYFGASDECHMAFHFPLMPRLFMATRMEDRFPITEILQLTPPIPEGCQWALFLRNHDELTLEMVTDEERDYMYRVYAHDRQMRINLGIRRRLAPLLGNDRRRIELMNALLLSLPGTPVIYYGDEIGMGDNFYLGDRNGVRTPMQWSGDRNAGFSRANPQRLYLPVIIDPEYHYESVNVEAQQNNPHSLLWWMKRIIEQRKRSKAFGRGSLAFLYPENRRVLVFVRTYAEERILVVANLSRFVQYAELDLSAFRGLVPTEMIGRNRFPPISEKPYGLSLGPHTFYWFALEAPATAIEASVESASPQAAVAVGSWEEAFSERMRPLLSRLLPAFLERLHWLRTGWRSLRTIEILDYVPVPASSIHLLILRASYSEGDPEYYVLPLAATASDAAAPAVRNSPELVLARLAGPEGAEGVLYCAIQDQELWAVLLNAMARRRRLRGEEGELVGSHTRAFRQAWGPDHPALQANPIAGDYNNFPVNYGDRFVLKLLRKVEAGVHPEREVGRLLAEKAADPLVAPLAGAIEYQSRQGDRGTLAVLHAFLKHESDGWGYTMDHLGLFFEHALAAGGAELMDAGPHPPLLSLAETPPPQTALDLMGSYLEMIRLLGRRTAELHAALSGRFDDPDFAPEAFTDFYRHGLYHGMLGQAMRCFEELRAHARRLPAQAQEGARRLLERAAEIRERFQALRDARFRALRIRIHGDYNLRQVLFTGKDFRIIDFEGNVERPLSERRIKRSPLRDVAGMLRSFHYAAHAPLFGEVPGVLTREEYMAPLEQWARYWYEWVGAAFLRGYLDAAEPHGFLPDSPAGLRIVLEAYLLERAITEVRRELRLRPDWARIPILGMLDLLERRQG
ncbi:MAG TPA: maltose alpha-D-glucosyltransferase [Bryobacteraceae bacterium]|nr:maltose alpha-D-glucosyltransferase [Bryobacteraceae bacterium]